MCLISRNCFPSARGCNIIYSHSCLAIIGEEDKICSPLVKDSIPLEDGVLTLQFCT